MAPLALSGKARQLIGPRSFKLISTFVNLKQEAQLAEPSPPETPLPPNPASGSPRYNENWRNPGPNASTSDGSLIPAGLGYRNEVYAGAMRMPTQPLDAKGLMDYFVDLVPAQKWEEIKQTFELWVRTLDKEGKPNKPDVNLYNQYLLANFRLRASAGELLDLVAQMIDYGISPNTASYNIVLKAMQDAGETLAAEKLIQRMLQTGKEHKESLPDVESYSIVIDMLLQRNQIDSALNYIDLTMKSGYMLSRKAFADCVLNCVKSARLDALVSIIERCKNMDQNKSLCPPWHTCINLAAVAMGADNSDLTSHALSFMAQWIRQGELQKPVVHRSVYEGLVISALGTAGRTYNSRLLDESWAILQRSLRKKNYPSPESYIAKIFAYANLGNLQKAFMTLRELEKTHGNSGQEDGEDLFSPFDSLNPLVVACSKKGFMTLDEVYYQLENLNQASNPYKSLAALNCVILGCANIWDLDRAYQTFSSIDATFGLTPNIHSYNALIYAFGKHGMRDEAVKVFDHFTGLDVKPNAMTFSLLVDAHLIKRDPKAALSVIDEMIYAGYEPSKEILLKVRRRCVREMDYESCDKVESLGTQFKIRMGTGNRQNLLFNLQYSMDSA